MIDEQTRTAAQFTRHLPVEIAARKALIVLENVDRALKGGMLWSNWQTWRLSAIAQLRAALDVDPPAETSHRKTEP
jgi:hypothetical protein